MARALLIFCLMIAQLRFFVTKRSNKQNYGWIFIS